MLMRLFFISDEIFVDMPPVSKSKIRGWIFGFVVISSSISVVLVNSVLIFNHSKEFSNYSNHNYCQHSELKMILRIFLLALKTMLTVDCVVCVNTCVASLYIGCLTMKIWLHQVWLVKKLMYFLNTFNSV